jgi:uncharacterized protein YcbK (DUF882 family)
VTRSAGQNERVSAHFAVREFDCHDGTEVPRYAYGDLERLARRYLEPLRVEFGPVRVVSGYRTRSYNRSVGGVAGSYHVYRRARPGVAADIECRIGEPYQWAAFLDELGPGGLGRYQDHVHVDNREGHARW